jgi:hypothetical protein
MPPQQLADDLPQVAPLPARPQHADVRARVRSDVPLAEDMRPLEVREGRTGIPGRQGSIGALHFRVEGRAKLRMHVRQPSAYPARRLLRIQGHLLPGTVALVHGLECRAVHEDLGSRRMAHELEQLRREPVSLVEALEIDIQRVVGRRLADDIHLRFRRIGLAVHIPDQLGDAEAFGLGGAEDSDVVAV